MPRAAFAALVLLGGLQSPAGAHHFAIDLEVRSGAGRQMAHAEAAAIGSKPKARAVLEVRSGAPVTVKWTLRSADPKATFKDVVVHFFIVKEEAAGQPSVPKLDRDVVAESALTMDFKPGDQARGGLTATVEKPGNYLLRLETIGAAVGVNGHEHFAAVDMVVR
jgi:hypothetical protein